MNYKIVFKILSKNLFIIAVSLVFCTGIAFIYSENILPFIYSTLISLVTGGIFHILSKMQTDRLEVQKKRSLFIRDPFLDIYNSYWQSCPTFFPIQFLHL